MRTTTDAQGEDWEFFYHQALSGGSTGLDRSKPQQIRRDVYKHGTASEMDHTSYHEQKRQLTRDHVLMSGWFLSGPERIHPAVRTVVISRLTAGCAALASGLCSFALHLLGDRRTVAAAALAVAALAAAATGLKTVAVAARGVVRVRRTSARSTTFFETS